MKRRTAVPDGASVMRNLLGRLNARSADELHRVARFWGVPLSGSDRGRHVGTLYRTMADIRAARDIWDRLDPDARELVREFALTDTGPMTVAELAERLDQPETATRESVAHLLRAGILAREGDSQELPVGAEPRFFLPRELTSLFRRIQDEIDAGDLSGASLRVLLELVDDVELEETAGRWGIRVIPGLRRRAELAEQILKQVADPERVGRVAVALVRDAAVIWRSVRSMEGGPVALSKGLEESGLDGQTDDPRQRERIRRALAELETALLVWHTYRSDGSRWLFVPREVLLPGSAEPEPKPALQPFVTATVAPPPARHPHALAWDLLALLRELSTHGGPLWTPGEPLPRPWERRLNGRLWFGGEEVPPAGYLGFLLHLALAAGVVEPAARAPGEPKSALRPVPSEALRSWRGRRFADQTARLRAVWLASDEWEEGREREEVEVWGADWRGFRRKLLRALPDLPADEWFPLDDAARLLAETDPGLLGATFTAASARATGGDQDDPGAARATAVAQAVAVELETAFAWFGWVELGTAPSAGPALRVTTAGRTVDDGDAGIASDAAERAGPALTVTDDGLITLRQPSPVRVWSLSAFGDQESLRSEATYRLRPASIGRALAAGFDLDQIVAFLERQSGGALPPPLATALREWTAGYRRVRLRRAVLLLPDNLTARDELRRLLTAHAEAGIEVIDLPRDAGGDGQRLLALLPATGEDADDAEQVLLTILRDAGYTGQWLPADPRPRPRD